MGTNGMDTGQSGPGSGTPMDNRMTELESLFLGGPLAAQQHVSKSFSIETLVDILVVLFDECSGSSLRREKTVSEFIELGKTLSSSRLHLIWMHQFWAVIHKEKLWLFYNMNFHFVLICFVWCTHVQVS